MFNSYPDVLSVKQLCEILDIGKNTAYKLLQSGEIKSIKIGKVYKIQKKCLKDFLNNR
ncbi:MAG: helix-turn-helix domain-containing protein [Ruminococcaceae bacterium]|nr:helix-turn-helix domain-containing protein [Oscillospiraceae bacterium]